MIPQYNKLCKELDFKKKLESGSSINLPSPFDDENSAESSGQKTSQLKISFNGYPKILSQDCFDNYVVVSSLLRPDFLLAFSFL